jgi:hypothetical protein
MGLAKNGRVSSCWTCGSHSIVDTLCEVTKETWNVVREYLKSISSLDDWAPKHKKKGRVKLPVGVGPLLSAHLKYLKKRDFDPNVVGPLWNLQGIGISPTHAWRIFIPVIQYGRTVSWTTRSISEDDSVPKKYKNADSEEEEISIKDTLFGIDLVRNAILICEGPFDAMRIGPGAVATYGLSYTKQQINLMVNYPVRIVCFDNEPQAQEVAHDLCKKLTPFPGTTINVAIDAKDPGCATQKEIAELRKEFLD